MFSEATTLFSEENVLEQAKTRLWWGYSLLLDSRPSAASEQLQEVIRLSLGMGDLIRGLGSTVAEVRNLLLHFLHRTDTPMSMRNNIWLLLTQSREDIDTTSPGLQIFAFGSPLVIAADKRKQFNQRGGMSKAPEFLLYLMLEGQDHGCTWSEVSTAIWPDLNREKASVKFHQILRSLRRSTLVGRDYILVQGDYYQINPNYLEWCDALAFNQLFDRLARSSTTETLALYLELISLYQGEFLTGFELSEWGETYRTQYETRYLQVVELASEQLVSNNAPREALNVINLGLSQDYFREELHRNAFKAYAQAGLYDDLVTHYSELCYTFDLELDETPSVSTKQLYEQLLVQKEYMK
jgi:DNA-binding SARP family transcriptional activator